jgi:hypothetical protein
VSRAVRHSVKSVMDGMRELLLATHAKLDGTRTPVITDDHCRDLRLCRDCVPNDTMRP